MNRKNTVGREDEDNDDDNEIMMEWNERTG